MTLLWLIAWWTAAMPPALVGPTWNAWGVVLLVSAATDAITGIVLAHREVARPEVERVFKPGIGWTNAGPELWKEK
jgi:hypothetical protein